MSKNHLVINCQRGRISTTAARNIAKTIYEYFQNPENIKAFEEWKKANSTSN